MYLGFFFALSHYHLPRQSDQQPWPQLQAAASADWGQGSAVARLISGFLNLQIEHHFAPRLSPEYMGTIAPEVKALCEKHGIAYQARRRPATRAHRTENRMKHSFVRCAFRRPTSGLLLDTPSAGCAPPQLWSWHGATASRRRHKENTPPLQPHRKLRNNEKATLTKT